MNKLSLFLAVFSLFSLPAVAAEKKAKSYLVNGKETQAYEAILASMRGETVMRCTEVKAQATKSGGITLKGIKATKSE